MPQPTGTPTSTTAACRGDFGHVLAPTAEYPAALERVADLNEGETKRSFNRISSPELVRAWQRLEGLPIPSGQHPYLDKILPALEAHRLLLVALSQTLL